MAYNEEKLARLKHLKELALRLAERCPTKTEMNVAIQAAIAGSGHAAFRKAEAVPEADAAEENVLYLVRNEETGHYDIYAKIDGAVEWLDDTAADLAGYVEKVEGKGLSTNDFTDGLKAKLEALPEAATDAEVAEMLAEVFL